MNKRGYIAIAVIVLLAAAAVAYFVFLRPSARDKAPASDKGKVVVALDAGHGGTDPGAVSGDFNEKVVNLAVMKKVAALFASDPKIRVITTRTLDLKVPNEDRIKTAEDGGASMYISLHVNSFPQQSNVNGIGTWVDTTRKQADASYQLAAILEDSLVTSTGARNAGIRTQESYTQRTKMPAVTVEMGFITNPAERTLLFDSIYQDKLAAGIASGIRQFIAQSPATQPASTAPATTPKTTTPAATSTTKKP
jgi:N-acetylmuramoyl-L-alanine amidase